MFNLDFLSQVYNSTAFSIFKFIVGIYVVVVFVDVVLMLYQRGLKANWRETLTGLSIPTELTSKKKKLKKKWEIIAEKLAGGNEAECKIAVIEADDLIDDILAKAGYKGENFSERLRGIPAEHFSGIENLKKAHETRNRIIHEENFRLEEKEAKEIMGYYAEVLRYFQVIE